MSEPLDRARDWFVDGQMASARGRLAQTQGRAVLALLEEQRRQGLAGALAEIGVFVGRGLIGLARAAAPGERVFGLQTEVAGPDLTPELVRNLQLRLSEAELGRIALRRASSSELDASAWAGHLQGSARFVRLSGQADRPSLRHDLTLAAAALAPGGVIVIDDVLSELAPDLTVGLLEALSAQPGLEAVALIPRTGPAAEGGAQLVCTSRGASAAYRRALDGALCPPLRPALQRFLSGEVRVYAERPAAPTAHAPAAAARQGEALPVVFALEDRSGSYWLNTAVALTSLAQHARRQIHVHLLHAPDLHETARRRLAEIADSMGVPLTLTPVALPAGLDPKALRSFGPAAIYRLIIPRLFADHPLVVYLDSDIVVNGLDIGQLAEAAPIDQPLAAVHDRHQGRAERHLELLAQMDLDPATYVNSGVLAIRPALISEDLVEAFLAFTRAYPQAAHPDQDFLNRHFKGRIALVDTRFNLQLVGFDKELLRPLTAYRGAILHYSGKIKPLDGVMSPALVPFWAHAHRTPEILDGQLYDVSRYILAGKDPDTVLRRRIALEAED